MKLAARCMVTRGIEGSYENGEIATGRIEVLSYNMPVRITIIIPAVELEAVLSKVEEMVTEGIVAVRDVQVVAHKTREASDTPKCKGTGYYDSQPKTGRFDNPCERCGQTAPFLQLYGTSGCR